ncbi:MAG: hypothetical protein KGL35_12065, partial [Bradyrhizobium sp.]|nr:hypothetical protein [Bradyrhizobium sp.]
AAAKGKAGNSAGDSPLCIVPDCTRPAKMRGVCASCYQNASKLIQRGGTTWEELERLGLVRPPHAGPKGYRAPLYRALEAARANEKAGKNSTKKGLKS